MRKPRIVLSFIAALTLVAPTLSACAAQLTEERLLRPVSGGTLSQEAVTRVAPVYTVTEHSIVAPDGVHLHAVLLHQLGARGTVLYFGGNAYTMERLGAATAAIFAPFGVDLMLVDHRGYGLSEGHPTVAALETDGVAAFDYLTRLRGVDRTRIIVHGQSLGSFTAGYVAAHRDAAAVILESSVTSTEDWVRSVMGPGVTVAPSLRGRGNLRHMQAISEPLMLLVGEADRSTPARLSQELFVASPLPADRKILTIVPGAGHNDVMLHPEAINAYRRFLALVLSLETLR